MKKFLSLLFCSIAFCLHAQVPADSTKGPYYPDTYSPNLADKIVKKRVPNIVVYEIRGVRGARKKGTKKVNDTIQVVETNVSHVPKYKGGLAKLKRQLNKNLTFTEKYLSNKPTLEYKIYIRLDETGKILGVEHFEGDKTTVFYSRLMAQLKKLDNWKPATLGEGVPYKIPLVILLRPSLSGNTYTISIAKPYTVETVF